MKCAPFSGETSKNARFALLATIVEAAPLAIVVADAGGHIVFANPDGSLVPVEVALTPIGELAEPFVLAILLDITQRRQLENGITRSYEELERRVQERTAELARSNAEKEVLLRGLEVQRNELERLSREDPLTGLANRREFDRHLHTAILYSQRHGTPLAVAMLDLDRFKRVNDGWGHAVGDAVLEETGRLLRRECRAIDVIARYGGEEFVLALPHADLPAAVAVCERVRRAFMAFDWGALAPGLSLTISAGVSAWREGRSGHELLAEADENLYRAKQHGRNRVMHTDYPAPLELNSDIGASVP